MERRRDQLGRYKARSHHSETDQGTTGNYEIDGSPLSSQSESGFNFLSGWSKLIKKIVLTHDQEFSNWNQFAAKTRMALRTSYGDGSRPDADFCPEFDLRTEGSICSTGTAWETGSSLWMRSKDTDEYGVHGWERVKLPKMSSLKGHKYISYTDDQGNKVFEVAKCSQEDEDFQESCEDEAELEERRRASIMRQKAEYCIPERPVKAETHQSSGDGSRPDASVNADDQAPKNSSQQQVPKKEESNGWRDESWSNRWSEEEWNEWYKQRNQQSYHQEYSQNTGRRYSMQELADMSDIVSKKNRVDKPVQKEKLKIRFNDNKPPKIKSHTQFTGKNRIISCINALCRWETDLVDYIKAASDFEADAIAQELMFWAVSLYTKWLDSDEADRAEISAESILIQDEFKELAKFEVSEDERKFVKDLLPKIRDTTIESTLMKARINRCDKPEMQAIQYMFEIKKLYGVKCYDDTINLKEYLQKPSFAFARSREEVAEVMFRWLHVVEYMDEIGLAETAPAAGAIHMKDYIIPRVPRDISVEIDKKFAEARMRGLRVSQHKIVNFVGYLSEVASAHIVIEIKQDTVGGGGLGQQGEKGKKPCTFFKKGKCHRKNCKFSHDPALLANAGMVMDPEEQQEDGQFVVNAAEKGKGKGASFRDECRGWLKNGVCADPKNCDKQHKENRKAAFKGRVCKDFLKNKCKYPADQCYFQHTSKPQVHAGMFDQEAFAEKLTERIMTRLEQDPAEQGEREPESSHRKVSVSMIPEKARHRDLKAFAVKVLPEDIIELLLDCGANVNMLPAILHALAVKYVDSYSKLEVEGVSGSVDVRAAQMIMPSGKTYGCISEGSPAIWCFAEFIEEGQVDKWTSSEIKLTYRNKPLPATLVDGIPRIFMKRFSNGDGSWSWKVISYTPPGSSPYAPRLQVHCGKVSMEHRFLQCSSRISNNKVEDEAHQSSGDGSRPAASVESKDLQEPQDEGEKSLILAALQEIMIEKVPERILGVDTKFAWEEVRTAYLKRSMEMHPDKMSRFNDKEVTNACVSAFQKISEAYLELKKRCNIETKDEVDAWMEEMRKVRGAEGAGDSCTLPKPPVVDGLLNAPDRMVLVQLRASALKSQQDMDVRLQALIAQEPKVEEFLKINSPETIVARIIDKDAQLALQDSTIRSASEESIEEPSNDFQGKIYETAFELAVGIKNAEFQHREAQEVLDASLSSQKRIAEELGVKTHQVPIPMKSTIRRKWSAQVMRDFAKGVSWRKARKFGRDQLRRRNHVQKVRDMATKLVREDNKDPGCVPPEQLTEAKVFLGMSDIPQKVAERGEYGFCKWWEKAMRQMHHWNLTSSKAFMKSEESKSSPVSKDRSLVKVSRGNRHAQRARKKKKISITVDEKIELTKNATFVDVKVQDHTRIWNDNMLVLDVHSLTKKRKRKVTARNRCTYILIAKCNVEDLDERRRVLGEWRREFLEYCLYHDAKFISARLLADGNYAVAGSIQRTIVGFRDRIMNKVEVTYKKGEEVIMYSSYDDEMKAYNESIKAEQQAASSSQTKTPAPLIFSSWTIEEDDEEDDEYAAIMEELNEMHRESQEKIAEHEREKRKAEEDSLEVVKRPKTNYNPKAEREFWNEKESSKSRGKGVGKGRRIGSHKCDMTEDGSDAPKFVSHEKVEEAAWNSRREFAKSLRKPEYEYDIPRDRHGDTAVFENDRYKINGRWEYSSEHMNDWANDMSHEDLGITKIQRMIASLSMNVGPCRQELRDVRKELHQATCAIAYGAQRLEELIERHSKKPTRESQEFIDEFIDKQQCIVGGKFQRKCEEERIVKMNILLDDKIHHLKQEKRRYERENTKTEKKCTFKKSGETCMFEKACVFRTKHKEIEHHDHTGVKEPNDMSSPRSCKRRKTEQSLPNHPSFEMDLVQERWSKSLRWMKEHREEIAKLDSWIIEAQSELRNLCDETKDMDRDEVIQSGRDDDIMFSKRYIRNLQRRRDDRTQGVLDCQEWEKELEAESAELQKWLDACMSKRDKAINDRPTHKTIQHFDHTGTKEPNDRVYGKIEEASVVKTSEGTPTYRSRADIVHALQWARVNLQIMEAEIDRLNNDVELQRSFRGSQIMFQWEKSFCKVQHLENILSRMDRAIADEERDERRADILNEIRSVRLDRDEKLSEMERLYEDIQEEPLRCLTVEGTLVPYKEYQREFPVQQRIALPDIDSFGQRVIVNRIDIDAHKCQLANEISESDLRQNEMPFIAQLDHEHPGAIELKFITDEELYDILRYSIKNRKWYREGWLLGEDYPQVLRIRGVDPVWFEDDFKGQARSWFKGVDAAVHVTRKLLADTAAVQDEIDICQYDVDDTRVEILHIQETFHQKRSSYNNASDMYDDMIKATEKLDMKRDDQELLLKQKQIVRDRLKHSLRIAVSLQRYALMQAHRVEPPSLQELLDRKEEIAIEMSTTNHELDFENSQHARRRLQSEAFLLDKEWHLVDAAVRRSRNRKRKRNDDPQEEGAYAPKYRFAWNIFMIFLSCGLCLEGNVTLKCTRPEHTGNPFIEESYAAATEKHGRMIDMNCTKCEHQVVTKYFDRWDEGELKSLWTKSQIKVQNGARLVCSKRCMLTKRTDLCHRHKTEKMLKEFSNEQLDKWVSYVKGAKKSIHKPTGSAISLLQDKMKSSEKQDSVSYGDGSRPDAENLYEHHIAMSVEAEIRKGTSPDDAYVLLSQPKNQDVLEDISNKAKVLAGRISQTCIDATRSKEHQQANHIPYDGECETCVKAGARRRKHGRCSDIHIGVLAVDLVSLNKGEANVLVATTQIEQDGKRFQIIHAEPIESKGAEDCYTGICNAICDMEVIWPVDVVKRVHSDQERGIQAVDDRLKSRLIGYTDTGGEDPAANGLAELAVGKLCRAAKASLMFLSDGDTKRELWTAAMRHASFTISANALEGIKGCKISSSDVLPFGCRIIALKQTSAKDKIESKWVDGFYISPSAAVSKGSVLGVVEGNQITEFITSSSVRKVMVDKKHLFCDVKIIETQHKAARIIICKTCNKHRCVDRKAFKKLTDRGFKCTMLKGTTCNTAEAEDHKTIPVRVGRPKANVARIDDGELDATDLNLDERNDRLHEIKDYTEIDRDELKEILKEVDDVSEEQKEFEDSMKLMLNNNPEEQVVRLNAGVTKLCTKDELKTAEAIASRKKEIEKLWKYGSFDTNPVEFDWAKSAKKGNTFSRLGMITSIKFWEKLASERVWKSRGIIIGCKIWRMIDMMLMNYKGVQGWCPIGTLASARTVFGEALIWNDEIYTIDLESAYLQTPWYEEFDHYVSIPTDVVELIGGDFEKKWKALKYPVTRMKVYVYGHPLSGAAFVRKFLGVLRVLGFQSSDSDDALLSIDGNNCNEESIAKRNKFHEWGLLEDVKITIVVYVDDLAATGRGLEYLWKSLRKYFLFDDPRPVEDFLSMTIIKQAAGNWNLTIVSMENYAKMIVSEYESKYDTTVAISNVVFSDDLRNEEIECNGEFVGIISDIGIIRRAQAMLGMLLWICRVGRKDLCWGVSQLGSRITKWTPRCEEQLKVMVGYIKGSLDVCLTMRIHKSDSPADLWICVHADADWRAPKSYGGAEAAIVSKRGSYIPIEWKANGLPKTSIGTPHAETLAGHTGLQLGIVTVDTVSILDKQVELRGDNNPASHAYVKGYSAKLAAWSKMVNLRLSSFRDALKSKLFRYRHVPSKYNRANMFTKSVPSAAIVFERELNGLWSRKAIENGLVDEIVKIGEEQAQGMERAKRNNKGGGMIPEGDGGGYRPEPQVSIGNGEGNGSKISKGAGGGSRPEPQKSKTNKNTLKASVADRLRERSRRTTGESTWTCVSDPQNKQDITRM